MPTKNKKFEYVRLNAWVHPNHKKAIAKASKKHKISQSELIRKIISSAM